MTKSQNRFDFQGHRGAMGLVPENTIPSMIKALELGVTTLELDVVVSMDHQVVVSHEPYMSALFSSKPDGTPVLPREEKDFNIYRMTYQEIRLWDVGMRGNERFPGQARMKVYKPLLKTLVDSVEQYVKARNLPLPNYNIEIKSTRRGDDVFHPPPREFARLVMEVVLGKGIKERTTIQSFDTRSLVAAREMFPGTRISLLVYNSRSVKTNVDRLGFIPEVYSPYYKLVTPRLIRAAREKGMKVIPWTVNNLNSITRLIKMGVDGIISDYPGYFSNEAVINALRDYHGLNPK